MLDVIIYNFKFFLIKILLLINWVGIRDWTRLFFSVIDINLRIQIWNIGLRLLRFKFYAVALPVLFLLNIVLSMSSLTLEASIARI